MSAKLQKSYHGKTIQSLKCGGASYGYEPTTLIITFTDWTTLEVSATSVMYDQFSHSPVLSFIESESPIQIQKRRRKTQKNVRCPGVGSTPLHRTYGNPSAACPVCGKSVKLTKRSTIRYHKSMQ